MIFVLIPFYAGVKLIQKYKSEILALWEEKWSMTPAPQTADTAAAAKTTEKD
jgi:hypothetical protein